MLLRSQPLDPKLFGKFEEYDSKSRKDSPIKSQRMGHMFDKLLAEKRKVNLMTRFIWMMRRVKDLYHDVRWSIRNHIKWHKTLSNIRSWEGFEGMISVMQTHLSDYIDIEKKYGHSEFTYRLRKIESAEDVYRLLERMRDSHDYINRRIEEVDARYPKYVSLITEYENGSVSTSGDFISYDSGYVGIEAGKEPREGYFELIDGKYELVYGMNTDEVQSLLHKIKSYQEERRQAYDLAVQDSDNDFEKLNQLLKDNMYSWWD